MITAPDVQQDDTVDTLCRSKNATDCDQPTQKRTGKKAIQASNPTNMTDIPPSTSSHTMQDRPTRGREKDPRVLTRHPDSPHATGRPSSQSSILDTLKRMGSTERGKEGKLIKQGGAKTRSKSVQSK